MAVMNALVLQDVLVIHIKDVCAVNQALFARNNLVDEMQPAELSIKTNPNVIVLHFIQTEIHTMNVSFERKIELMNSYQIGIFQFRYTITRYFRLSRTRMRVW